MVRLAATTRPCVTLIATFLVVAASLAACDDEDGISGPQCRFEPRECDGRAGALCSDDRDCRAPLHCCTEDGNCGGGMCTLECRDDRDCPSDMLCEHDVCFYACDRDEDCAAGMSCEHGNTICEWP